MPDYSHYTDETLLSLIQTDDVAAFRELYDRYWKKLLARASYMLRSNQDAEDITHDIFVDIWRRRAELLVEHSFHTYIIAAINYSCLHKLAEKKSLQLTGSLNIPEPADLSTEHYLSLRELQDRFQLAMNELPEKCNLIFRMSREAGLTDQQIANELDLSLHTIRTQKHRAIQKLKFTLGRLGSLFLFF